MLQIYETNSYIRELKKFVKNNLSRAQAVGKVLRLFTLNQRHPSLKTEKLAGSSMCSMRIDKGNRIFFIWINDGKVLFLDVGAHDKYRKY